MSGFRTSSLFRFCANYELFSKILRNGIIPNYCEEDLSTKEREFCIGIPMASFCDIPITRLDEHTSRYGVYGIGLSKKWGIDHGISPVMYIANDDILKTIYYHADEENNLREKVSSPIFKDKVQKSLLSGGNNFIEFFLETLKNDTLHSINISLFGFLKKYNGIYKGKLVNNYEENEWRYLVPDEAGTKWMWSRKKYEEWRGIIDGKERHSKPAPNAELKKFTLTFHPKDVKYIMVKDEEFKNRVFGFIKDTDKFGGNKIESEERDLLLTRIITIDQVKEDF